MDCIFCKIIAGEIPCHKIAETEHALAFLDIMPIAHGHLLVIPKQHIEFVYDADPAVMADVMALATRIAGAVNRSIDCEGMNLLLNAGRVAGQIVPHAHMHIIPRRSDDGIHWPWPQGTLTDDTAQELVASITGNLS
jgi:histidine triad (HIT) family protein